MRPRRRRAYNGPTTENVPRNGGGGLGGGKRRLEFRFRLEGRRNVNWLNSRIETPNEFFNRISLISFHCIWPGHYFFTCSIRLLHSLDILRLSIGFNRIGARNGTISDSVAEVRAKATRRCSASRGPGARVACGWSTLGPIEKLSRLNKIGPVEYYWTDLCVRIS